MLRRLLTCLALITGLAAAGAPLNAGVIDAVSQQVGPSKSVSSIGSAEENECRAQRATAPSKQEEQGDCKPRRSVVIYIPTVQLGVDRALE